MCGLFGTSSRDKIKPLAIANMERGNASWSITCFEIENNKFVLTESFKGLGDFPSKLFGIPLADYYICHIQSPTTGQAQLSTVHPAEYMGGMLWHNGIIKQSTFKNYMMDFKWDTLLLLSEIEIAKGTVGTLEELLSTVEGTFACVYFDHGAIKIFRNELAPLFIDKELSISSVKFKDSKEVTSHKIYRFDLNSGIKEEGNFVATKALYYGL